MRCSNVGKRIRVIGGTHVAHLLIRDAEYALLRLPEQVETYSGITGLRQEVAVLLYKLLRSDERLTDDLYPSRIKTF